MSARFIVADVFDGLATLETGSVDLVVTSPPFLALRSYLPADHPDKGKEIGSEPTPAEFIDVMLRVSAELRRVLAPHGSICIELGDTYAGSGGAGGDYNPTGLRDGQERFTGSGNRQWQAKYTREQKPGSGPPIAVGHGGDSPNGGTGWPLAKSRTLIPQLYEIALAYGINPLTGTPSPAGQWRIRNVVTWARPNPPVGALGDKWRPATSDLIVACVSGKRYWDDLATRKPISPASEARNSYDFKVTASMAANPNHGDAGREGLPINSPMNPSGAPLLDYWEIPPGGYKGSHYAVFPEELVVPCVKAMCPERVCRTCGEPSRRILGEFTYTASEKDGAAPDGVFSRGGRSVAGLTTKSNAGITRQADTLGWTDCGHDDFRLGLVLDPFAGSGTTLAVASGHGHDAVGIDLDSRNADLARERIGPFLFDMAGSV